MEYALVSWKSGRESWDTSIPKDLVVQVKNSLRQVCPTRKWDAEDAADVYVKKFIWKLNKTYGKN